MRKNIFQIWNRAKKYVFALILLLCPCLMLPFKFFLTFNVRKISDISVGIAPLMVALGAFFGIIITVLLLKATHARLKVLFVIWAALAIGWAIILPPTISSVLLGIVVASMVASIPFVVSNQVQP